ncbi:MAG: alpha-mannosidase [Vicinamibacteria bacterium]
MQTELREIHVVSHTHWDREWYLTREQYRLRLVGLVDRVLDRLESEPRFSHFHLDGQTIVLEDYLEARPEAEPRLRAQIAAGRLLVGPWYVMPDMHLVSGEALVRNLARGHRLAEAFGGVMRAGYMPDPFGHVSQMPQILRGFGLDSAILWRGFGGSGSEYWWQAPDGTRALLLHLPREGYCNALRLPLLAPDEMRERGAQLALREAARSASGVVLLMAGVDHVEPHPGLLELPGRVAEATGAPARIASLPEHVAAVRAALRGREGELETIAGELRAGEEHAFLLPGVLSARVYLKQANVRAQAELERWTEPASSFAWLLGEPYPAGLLDYAWKTLLENHPHDSICGCSVDAVHEENLTRFARVQQTASGLSEAALAALARRAAPAPAATLRALAVNPGAAAEGVVVGEIFLPIESAEPGRRIDEALLEAPLRFFPEDAVVRGVRDSRGRALPFQVLEGSEQTLLAYSLYEPPWSLRARRLKVAVLPASVPGCGFETLDFELGAPATAADDTPAPAEGDAPVLANAARAGYGWLENDLVRLEVSQDGTLEVHDLRADRVVRGCLELEDVGDVGDEYNYSPPPADRRVTSAAARVLAVRRVEPGPLRASLRVDLELDLPSRATDERGARSDETVTLPIQLRVTLDAGSPRIDVRLGVLNRARDHRLRVLLPSGAPSVSTARSDSAFDLVERPARRPQPAAVQHEAPVSSFPLQSVVDAGDASAGVTAFAAGLQEYEVVESAQGPAIGLTLLRCVGDLSRDDLATRRGHAGPGLATPGAQCLGAHEFHLAFELRGAPPTASALFEGAHAFVAPPRLVAPAGPVPVRALADEPPGPTPHSSAPPSEPRSTGPWAAAAGDRGGLAGSGSFLTIECEPAGAAVLSALKRADERESLVVRLFDAEAVDAAVRLRALRPIREAYLLDLRERRQQPLAVSDGAVSLKLRGKGIATVELRFETGLAATPA